MDPLDQKAEDLWQEAAKNPPLDLIEAPRRPIHIGYYQRDDNRRVMLLPKMREYHMQLMGEPGKGKSRMLEKMICEDILAGHGLMLMDPSGNLYNDLVRWLIEKDIIGDDRIILIDPNVTDKAIGYNPLAITWNGDETPLRRQELIMDRVNAVMGAMSSMIGDENTEEMPLYSRVLRLILYVLAEQNLSLIEAAHLIRHGNPVQKILTEQSDNPIVKEAWSDLQELRQRDFQQWFMAPTNRFEKIVLQPTMQAIFGQLRNTIDFKEIMEGGKVALVNLNPVVEGYDEEDAQLLGRVLLNDMTNQARKRLRKNDKNPRAFYCYIDECDLFLTKSVVKGIEKLRQFGLHMILSHQGLSQLRNAGDQIYGAVERAQVKIYFGLSPSDSEEVAKAVGGGQIDFERVKETFNSPATVAYNREEFVDQTTGRSAGVGESTVKSEGRGTADSISLSIPHLGLLEQGVIVDTSGSSSSSFSGVAHAKSSFWSEMSSETRRTALVPELQWIPSQSYSMEEQLFQLSVLLQMQDPQYAMYRLPGQIYYCIKTPTVYGSIVDDQWLEKEKARYTERRSDLFFTKESVVKAIWERRDDILNSWSTQRNENRDDEDDDLPFDV